MKLKRKECVPKPGGEASPVVPQHLEGTARVPAHSAGGSMGRATAGSQPNTAAFLMAAQTPVGSFVLC